MRHAGGNPENYPLAILAPYHSILFNDLHKNGDPREGPRRGSPARVDSYTDIANFLPDITFADLLKNLGSIFCSAFFQEDGRLRMMSANSILTSGDAMDLDGKISDDFSSETAFAQKYSFGYQEGEAGEYDIDRLERDIANGKVATLGQFEIEDLFAQFKDDHTVVFCDSTKDVYSGRHYRVKTGTRTETYYEDVQQGETWVTVEKTREVDVFADYYESDVIYQGSKTEETTVEDKDAEGFSNISDFLAVRCVPEKTNASKAMAPIINPEAVSGDRSKKAYIGIIHLYNCLVSNGYSATYSKMDAMFQGRGAITPDALWDKYHKAFAQWLGKTRQRVAVDVNLTPVELHNFRLYRPVYFRGRKWIVAKLSVTVAAGSDRVTTRGEFIEI